MTCLCRHGGVGVEVQLKPICNLGAKTEKGVSGQRHNPGCFTLGKDSVRVLHKAGSAWTGAENLTPTGTRSSNRQVRSESLCRLHYPDRHRLKYQ